MERGGSGGFHGYRRPQTSSGVNPVVLPEQMNHQTTGDDTECTVREQDRFMPIANVIRIMRRILPPHAKISDDAKETIQECVSEYISFVTGEANDRCQREQRKTITAEDVLWAMSKLGFDDYIEPLTVYLHRYRELDGGDRGAASIRSEAPPGRRTTVDPAGTLAFHVGHHHGLFGAAAMAGFMKDAAAPPNAAGSSGASLEPYARCKE